MLCDILLQHYRRNTMSVCLSSWPLPTWHSYGLHFELPRAVHGCRQDAPYFQRTLGIAGGLGHTLSVSKVRIPVLSGETRRPFKPRLGNQKGGARLCRRDHLSAQSCIDSLWTSHRDSCLESRATPRCRLCPVTARVGPGLPRAVWFQTSSLA